VKTLLKTAAVLTLAPVAALTLAVLLQAAPILTAGAIVINAFAAWNIAADVRRFTAR
jgi:hypothetical protein